MDISKKRLKRAIDEKACRVNGRIETFASHKLREGDRVAFDEKALERKGTWTVLYEDERMIVFDKPPFVPVDSRFTVHRLDKETSGVIMMAKGDPAPWIALFRERLVSKTYFAVCVMQKPFRPGAKVDVRKRIKVAHERKGRKIMTIDPHGALAVTEGEVVAVSGRLALVKATPLTGKTHQIRLHLALIHLPILGDAIYGIHEGSRMMLHSFSLSFPHPFTGEEMKFTAPVPEAFLEIFDARCFS
ncbi:MAG: hypothetical protein A3F09_03935 [Chlamydiae bacterium RIFCSPHIGHO2_12_FULL_49_11]|nr:MAG: hypothetical protein A3F09_03935 [Chlamydiae bacterium RIFCSPHIGHO2_12_FULL_49_11]